MEIVVFSLLVLVGFQQWFFLRQIQTLVDKLMSRSFQEYKQTEAPVPRETNREAMPLPEDLRTLQPFQVPL